MLDIDNHDPDLFRLIRACLAIHAQYGCSIYYVRWTRQNGCIYVSESCPAIALNSLRHLANSIEISVYRASADDLESASDQDMLCLCGEKQNG